MPNSVWPVRWPRCDGSRTPPGRAPPSLFAAAAQDLDDLKIFARTQELLRRLICVCGMSPFGLNGCVSTAMPLMMKSCVPTFFTARARRPVCASRAPLWRTLLYQPMAQPPCGIPTCVFSASTTRRALTLRHLSRPLQPSGRKTWWRLDGRVRRPQ